MIEMREVIERPTIPAPSRPMSRRRQFDNLVVAAEANGRKLQDNGVWSDGPRYELWREVDGLPDYDSLICVATLKEAKAELRQLAVI